MTSTDVAGNMPLNQEKRANTTISNNNDHNYLHKKFKKMASTAPVLTANQSRGEDVRQKEINVIQNASITPIPNGSISAAHPEIEKIKEIEHRQYMHAASGNNVQINYSDENNRLGNNVNTVQVSGQTSLTDEFLNKTENLENDFIREAYNGTVGGRYICPYCKLSCAKPSVLQKHIRAHTNERPYPCIPCGFAFKTKSNLYKHRRSRMHALRLQGTDVNVASNDDEVSGGSESDTPTSISEAGSDISNFRMETLDFKPVSPDALTDLTQQRGTNISPSETCTLKTIYKPKFRAAFYRESCDKDKLKKPISPSADFLNEHISKIISDNEAIIDVIETPLQKKYGKIKQIAESKQFMNDMHEVKSEMSPLNLTKSNNEIESSFRKRSHSESFSQGDFQKHPLNPEGSIIKDLLLKTKMNGMVPITGELLDGPLYLCSVCQIMYRSADNLEIHKLYYCKGNINSNVGSDCKDVKVMRSDNIFVRSNSVNVRLPETSSSALQKSSYSAKTSARLKPENLVITKPDYNDVIAPLPSPGPLLGNTRLVDTRISSEYGRKNDGIKVKTTASPKRKIESNSETYSPRLVENISPRSTDLYSHQKLRCVETSANNLRSIEEISPNLRNNSTSLQMFGGEVKILDHSGSTTTLRIEPNKNQLSPIMIQTNLSPSKLISDIEASSVVVRSGLHSGGTIVHNPPTPKETLGTPQPQTTRMTISATTTCVSNLPNIHDITHFQFPPLSAITAFNPLTLPPLSPSTSMSPNGATKILHGGKLIPHVPGIPGPNTSSIYVGSTSTISKNHGTVDQINLKREDTHAHLGTMHSIKSPHGITKYDTHNLRNSRSPNLKMTFVESEKHIKVQDVLNNDSHYVSSIPIINIKNVEDTNIYASNALKQLQRQEAGIKRNAEGVLRSPVLKENTNFSSNKLKNKTSGLLIKPSDLKNDKEIRNFNFENLITKTEIFNHQGSSSSDYQKNSSIKVTSCATPQNERSEPLYFQKNVLAKSSNGERKPKFLRPSTLPLKPGTFTPKRHHGITPNANTMPLVSPETPRPAKAYGQLYLNGNAYTYLGLKCSTKVFYCTINRPQPTYVPNQHFLSMYSNWQLLSELTPDPLGLSASSAMSLYDSRHRPQNMSVATIKHDLILTHSSQWNTFIKENKQTMQIGDLKKSEETKSQSSENLLTPKKELTGGFESNEEYTYVRGRGRGRYVCSECGIRCKKPSMLKKHIRTHTDVRPYTCVHCAFSFKTKGNLTKHMKSKAHYKKCCELGINPNDGDVDTNETAQCSGETDDDTDSDGDEGNEGETESSDTEAYKSRLPEHEAAHCLLSLGGNRPSTSATPGLITSARPTTYPYTPVGLECIENYSEKVRTSPIEARIDIENEPMDLSRNEVKTPNMPEIPTARESSVLASLASNTAKLPQAQNQWANGEPLLHTYLTERALLDTKIKQSQVTSCLTKHKNIDMEKSSFNDNYSNGENKNNPENIKSLHRIKNDNETRRTNDSQGNETNVCNIATNEVTIDPKDSVIAAGSNAPVDAKKSLTQNNTNPNAENAKHVVSEYLKQAKINLIKAQEDMSMPQSDNFGEEKNGEDFLKSDEFSDSEIMKSTSILEHNSVATKVVIGVGGVAFKVTKGKEFESSSYPPGRIMEDGCRDCNFCNKTFTKPSQLRLHLNIHYMERPFRCSICAVSFRTRGHLQKHERSASHHNKISMTSTFGAATSFNPRPFRCSDCNIAFRIHGHLAKHLRSKMHVMRLECLFKLPFGTFTEIERAGVSLTDIDTTDCDSSLASLQLLAKTLHEKDPTKLEYRDPNGVTVAGLPAGRELSEDEDSSPADGVCVSEKNSDIKTSENNDDDEMETRVNCSATDI